MSTKTIFRKQALQYHRAYINPTVLPRLVAPRTFRGLWLLLISLIVAAVMMWQTEIPVFTSGLAIVVDDGEQQQDIQTLTAVIVLPAQVQPYIQMEQLLLLEEIGADEVVRGHVTAVEPNILSPAAINEQFSLQPGTASLIRQPSAVALAKIDASTSEWPMNSFKGSSFPVQVQTDSRSILSLLFGER